MPFFCLQKATRTGISGLLLRGHRTVEELRLTGVKAVDDLIKVSVFYRCPFLPFCFLDVAFASEYLLQSITPAFKESVELRENTENVIFVFKEECGLNQSASLRQCVRVLVQRFSSPSGSNGKNLSVNVKDGFPQILLNGAASDSPRKVLTAFENASFTYQTKSLRAWTFQS